LLLTGQFSRSSTGGRQPAEPLHAVVVLSDVSDRHTAVLLDVEHPDRNLVLEVRPVLRRIEERFEASRSEQPGSGPLATELIEVPTLRLLDIQVRCVQEHVQRRLLPARPGLALTFE
jgi:hypothetical protein